MPSNPFKLDFSDLAGIPNRSVATGNMFNEGHDRLRKVLGKIRGRHLLDGLVSSGTVGNVDISAGYCMIDGDVVKFLGATGGSLSSNEYYYIDTDGVLTKTNTTTTPYTNCTGFPVCANEGGALVDKRVRTDGTVERTFNMHAIGNITGRRIANSFFDAEEYGDGKTDVEINAAITAAFDAGGGIVVLSAGTWTISSDVIMNKQVSLEGVPAKWDNGSKVVTGNSSKIIMDHGASLINLQVDVYVDPNGVDYCTIRDCYFKSNSNFELFDGCKEWIIDGCRFEGAEFDLESSDNSFMRSTISNCDFFNSAGDACTVRGYQITIRGNSFYGRRGLSITNGGRYTITGNIISMLAAGGDIALHINYMEYSTIDGNVVRCDGGGIGIYVAGAIYSTISNNQVRGNVGSVGDDGIKFTGSTLTTDIVVSGNEVHNNGSISLSAYGIEINGNAHKFNIVGNVVTNFLFGILLVAPYSNVNGNILHGPGGAEEVETGLVLYAANYCNIVGNVFTRWYYGVRVTYPSVPYGHHFSGNHMAGISYGIFFGLNTGTAYQVKNISIVGNMLYTGLSCIWGNHGTSADVLIVANMHFGGISMPFGEVHGDVGDHDHAHNQKVS